MEEPFRLLILLLIAALACGIIFYEIRFFNFFINQRSVEDDLAQVVFEIDSLRKLSSWGSFSRVSLRIPEGYSLVFNNKTNVIELLGLSSKNYSLNCDILNFLVLAGGTHDLQLYYGNLSYELIKNETLVFS